MAVFYGIQKKGIPLLDGLLRVWIKEDEKVEKITIIRNLDQPKHTDDCQLLKEQCNTDSNKNGTYPSIDSRKDESDVTSDI